jgi:hypothetical protein
MTPISIPPRRPALTGARNAMMFHRELFVFHLGAAQHHLEIFVGGLPAREPIFFLRSVTGLDASAFGDNG